MASMHARKPEVKGCISFTPSRKIKPIKNYLKNNFKKVFKTNFIVFTSPHKYFHMGYFIENTTALG